MGNNPSTAKPVTAATAGQSSSSSSHHHVAGGNDAPKPARREAKHPISLPNQRSAAPPEPSLAQALGSTVNRTSSAGSGSNRPKSLQPRPIAGLNSSSPSSSTTSSSLPTSRGLEAPKPARNEPSKPVAVPNPAQDPPERRSPPSAGLEDQTVTTHSSVQDMSYMTRPPRLPLPIEEEIHTPGSPIISATDIGEPIDDDEALEAADDLTRKSSALSTTTIDDDDAEELRVDKTRPTVPTRLEWRHGGEKVYVTGTIFQWNRKHRLHPVEGQPGVFAATMNILPGTHHVRFLVDGQMVTSTDLPTTVDFGNNLVNYIEVNSDDAAAEGPETPGSVAPAKEGDHVPGAPARTDEGLERMPKFKPIAPKEDFEYNIAKYLTDFDQPEDSPLYQNAVAAIERLPNPPSLPGFLGKPILNAAVLIKDDNSVLNMPNHTVLNHLATSSIKNNILAVSATTRYKSKYVTTIIYKPTSTDE